MRKLLTVLALAVAGLALSLTAQAQVTDSKLEWATKAVALQQGPELDRLIGQLAESSSQDVVQSWGVKMRANVPEAQQEKAVERLNVELRKYNDDVTKIIKAKIAKASADSLVPAYVERFSLDELKQLVTFFESPAVKKYQAMAPSLGNIFVNQLVMDARNEVTVRGTQFDEAASKIVGAAPKAPAPVAPEKSKPAVKK